MSYPVEKSPEALAALHGTSYPTTHDGIPNNPPPYDPTQAPPTILTSDEKAPAYSNLDRSGAISPNSLTCPSTASLNSLEEVTAPKTATTTTKFFISQQGNTLRPWPWSNSSELVTPIYDSARTMPLFTSTRHKKCSGSCVLAPVYNPDNQHQPLEGKDKFEVHTTYYFGPGNDPEISFHVGEGVEGERSDGKFVVPVRSKGKLTRTRYFEWNGERYEWRYLGNRHREGMVLQRVVSSAELHRSNRNTTSALPTTPPYQGNEKPHIIYDEKNRPATPTSPGCSKGKEKSKKTAEPGYITVAEFMRDEEENKRWMGFSPAGQGGWVTVYGKEGEGEGKSGLPYWLVLTSCLVMLKRERDRRTMQIAMMIGGGAGGGP